MPGLLDGQVALISGGISGIGRAVADLFVAQGAQVTVLDRIASDAAAGLDTVPGDVRDPAAHLTAVSQVLDRHGRLDILVGNAGIHDGGTGVTGVDTARLARIVGDVLAINLGGYIFGAHAAAPALRETRGCMIFTLSDAAYVVGANKAGVAYAASKHGALGVVRALAAELAPDVRVNGVAPGGVATNLRDAAAVSGAVGEIGEAHVRDRGALETAVTRNTPLGVMLDAAEVAHAYLFLACSPAARGMTGEVVRPDGGLSVR